MTVVFKLGGSLLTLPGLADKLRSVVKQRPGKRCLILTGGGAAADVVRDWSRIHHIDEETAHWLAISSLDLNRRLLESLLPWPSVSTHDEANRIWTSESPPVHLDVTQFVRREEAIDSEHLPHNWNVTSDSLAAWTVIRWPADELILLKSVPSPGRLTADEAAEQSLVDNYFPKLATRIAQISWCDVRASQIAIEPWLKQDLDQAK